MALTLEQAKALKPGDVLHATEDTNSKGECRRWKVNGRVQTWKTRPQEVRIPVKHGLYAYDAIRENELEYVHTEDECPFM